MQYLKKYFTEGLIQVAILLSLCGVRVDVGLESYLPSPWHEIILGPTPARTQAQFHDLCNRLQDGCDPQAKNVDLDRFFTARRLLGWVRSLDRVQVPHAELETWLVQREPDPLPIQCPDERSLLDRAPVGVERDRDGPSVDSRPGLGTMQEEVEADDKEEETHQVLHHNGVLDGRREEEEDEEEDLAGMHRHCRRTEERGRPRGSYSHANSRDLTQNEVDQTSLSLQECLRLFEETFPFTEVQQLSDVGGRREDLEHHLLGREPLNQSDYPSFDLEHHWQDLFAIMEPKNTDNDMMTSFEHTLDPEPSGTFWGVGSETLHQNCNNPDNSLTDADQDVHLIETPQQHGLLWSVCQSELEPALIPLTPSAELDDHRSVFNTRDVMKHSNVNAFHGPPDHSDLLDEDPSEDFCLGENGEDNLSTFDVNVLAQDLVDNMEGSPCLQYAVYPEDIVSFDVNLHSRDSTPSSSAITFKGNDITQDLLTSSSSVIDEEVVEDEEHLPSPLTDLLEDAAFLDEISLLDLALEEALIPEMAARLEEGGYLACKIAKQDTARDDDQSVSSKAVTEDQSESGQLQQDGEDEVDSDSGLSLNFSHGPVSPCCSEASYYSSSSSSSLTSSSSCVSAVESPLYEDKDEDAEGGSCGSDMEMELTIKEEELEEEMGAVGGGYPEDVKKLLPVNYGDHMLLNGFPWQEHINHDHTYNQPWPSASFPSYGKMPTKHTKSSLRHHNPRHYQRSSSRYISETKMRSRDERRSRALKIPFSNELIVHLPVEEFNDLLTNYQLNEEQLALVRDIRRRGKNKIAAQNCRKRKLDVLVGLEDDVSALKRHRLRLLRENQDTLRNLEELKRQLSILYQEVFSRLRDEEGGPLDATEYLLHFGPNGSFMVASRQKEGYLPLTGAKKSKKQRNKKK